MKVRRCGGVARFTRYGAAGYSDSGVCVATDIDLPILRTSVSIRKNPPDYSVREGLGNHLYIIRRRGPDALDKSPSFAGAVIGVLRAGARRSGRAGQVLVMD